jgi:hypothetical protein
MEKIMATAQPKEASEILGEVDWTQYHDHRLMPLWKVAALSMGMTPMNALIDQAKRNDRNWGTEYAKRKRHLLGKLSAMPQEGLVTYFPNYAGGIQKAARANLTIDMVSAIGVLQKRYGHDMPEAFLALEKTLKEVSLPYPLNVPPITTAHAPARKSQVNRNTVVQHENLLVLIYALAKKGYGYAGEENTCEQDKANMESICTDVRDMKLSRYGLGSPKIREFILAGRALANKEI